MVPKFFQKISWYHSLELLILINTVHYTPVPSRRFLAQKSPNFSVFSDYHGANVNKFGYGKFKIFNYLEFGL